jgi:hypothetical protein
VDGEVGKAAARFLSSPLAAPPPSHNIMNELKVAFYQVYLDMQRHGIVDGDAAEVERLWDKFIDDMLRGFPGGLPPDYGAAQ